MTHLTLGERYEISVLHEQGRSKAEIGRKLGRHRSTVGREIKRNADGRSGRYRAELAQGKALARHEGKNKHKAFTPAIRDFVAEKLKKDLSPEQIKGRADLDTPPPCVSPERIYQFVWPDKKKGGELYLHMRTRGKKYRERGDKKAGRGLMPNRVDIAQRPAIVDKKERLGDLEIDLIIGKGHKGALLTINDRVTGMLKMAHVEGKEAKAIEAMCGTTGGISTTCLLATCSAIPERPLPHRSQKSGQWSTTVSGSGTISRVLPPWPGCPPILRFDFGRRLWFFLGRFSSLDGGTELLRLFFGFSYPARRPSSSETRSRNAPFSFSSTSKRAVRPSIAPCRSNFCSFSERSEIDP